MNSIIPLLRPEPVRLSALGSDLARIEEAGLFSNFGPVNRQFEQALVAELFGGRGHSVTMCNATIALMLAILQATEGQPPARRYALMPSFTFAATAHAALWSRLTPLLCDIEPETWLACPQDEERLLQAHAGQVAVIVACTTFGNPVDLGRYRRLAARYGCALVVDAAAALGTTTDGGQFETGSPDPIVFSMHATKPFATLEGAVIYADAAERIAALRAMANFGFAEPRVTSLPGLNAKMNEITALLALRKLAEFPGVVAQRYARESEYRALLPDFEHQRMRSQRNAATFASVLAPPGLAGSREVIRQIMLGLGVQTGAYFSPHLARHPYFIGRCVFGDLPVSDDVAGRIIALPMSDTLPSADVERVADALRTACAQAIRAT